MECFFEPMIKGTIIKRPSKHCKSPYVADVLLENGEEVIAHAPSLGCCGLCEKNSVVYMTLSKEPKTCTRVIHLGQHKDTIVGIHPKSGEKIVEFALKYDYVPPLKNLKKLEREKKMLNSRFDFMGIDQDNKRFILEVKSVPLCQDEVAFFPDGYRKKKTVIISPRALKHIQELQQIKEMHPDYRTILCFVVQRSDATSFRISDNDPIYKDAVKEAITKGVEIIVLQIIWNHYGQAMLGEWLPLEPL